MLEIFFLVILSRRLSKSARERDRSIGWAALGVVFWISGEFGGIVLGGIVGLEGFAAYPIALFFAGLGAGTAYVILSVLPLGARRDSPF